MITSAVLTSQQEAFLDSADVLPPRHRSDSIAAWLGVIALTAVTALFAHAWSERTGYVRLADMAVHQLNLHAAGLDSELGRYENLPALVELDPDLRRLLDEPNDVALRDKVNKDLLNLNVRAGARSIFVMAPDGVVLASSNWYEPESAVGFRLSNAPYYREAMRSGQARSFVVDEMRHTPECYFARTIVRNERVLGVVAVRISLEAIETSWIEFTAASQTEKLLVIDDRDVVIMSSNPEWKNKTVLPLARPPVSSAAPAARPGQAAGVLPVLGLSVERPLAFGTHLVNLPIAGLRERAQFLAEEQYMARPGWRLMTLSSVAGVQTDARTAAAGAAGLAALAGVVGVLGVYLLQRRRAIAQQMSARAALERARDELEARVQARTFELRQANQALVSEIAERRRTEEVLRNAQSELVQAGRLALLGQMSAAITHEVNQPLTALRALSDNTRQLLKAGRVADVERNLQLIADLTERLGKMTSQLKSFAHKGPASNGWVPLATAVNNVLQILEGRIRDEGIRLTLDVPGSLRVRCDAYRLEQVLLNLCSNAIDAMCDAPTKELAVTARADGQRVRVRVSDTGPGIPAHVKEHLFEPFFSTKPPGQGLGLGLVISSGMVGEFGGALRTVEVAQGAAFEFDLSMEEACSHV